SPILRAGTGSEPSDGQVLAVGALVGRRLALGIRQHVLLDNHPARVRVAHRVKHTVDVEIAFAEPAKRLSPPDLGDRRGLADDAVDHGAPCVLQMQMVDSLPPLPHRAHRVAPSNKQVASVEAQSDRGQIEHLLDLPRSFDVGTGLVVEGRLVAPRTAALGSHLNAFGKAPPRVLIETERWIFGRLSRARTAEVAANVSEGRSRGETVARPGRVE